MLYVSKPVRHISLYLVDFIIRNYHDARSPERQILLIERSFLCPPGVADENLTTKSHNSGKQDFIPISCT